MREFAALLIFGAIYAFLMPLGWIAREFVDNRRLQRDMQREMEGHPDA
jgi:hypothetical protein